MIVYATLPLGGSEPQRVEGEPHRMTSSKNNRTSFARKLRREKTPSERLLWALLRARQPCRLKFRRQHRIGPFFADVACCSEKLIVEISDGVMKFDIKRISGDG